MVVKLSAMSPVLASSAYCSSLKNELTHQTHYETPVQSKGEIVEWIEIFYNRVRRHAKLGNISPREAFLE